MNAVPTFDDVDNFYYNAIIFITIYKIILKKYLFNNSLISTKSY